MTREMVKVILYEDGEYEVIEADSNHTTQPMEGIYGNRYCEIYYCPKDKWKCYLLKLLSTKDIDDEIKELKKKKKTKEELKAKIKKEVGL